MKNPQPVEHNHEVEPHLLDFANFFNRQQTEILGVQKYLAPFINAL